MKVFYFDLETTGVMYWKNGIHQISGAIEIEGVVKEEFDFKVQPNPACLIEQGALDVGNVTKEQIMAYPPMIEVYNSIITILSKYVNKFNRCNGFGFRIS